VSIRAPEYRAIAASLCPLICFRAPTSGAQLLLSVTIGSRQIWMSDRTRTHPIAEMSARVQAMMLSPTAADDITRFFTARPTEPAPAG